MQHNPEKCNMDVYKHGRVQGVYAWTKQYAEDFCRQMTEDTDYIYDWHFSAGRVVVKTLKKDYESVDPDELSKEDV